MKELTTKEYNLLVKLIKLQEVDISRQLGLIKAVYARAGSRHALGVGGITKSDLDTAFTAITSGEQELTTLGVLKEKLAKGARDMTKITAVTAGEYSSYRVIACFTNTKKCTEFLAEYIKIDRYAGAEEFELDPEAPLIINVFQVTMHRDGRASTTKELSNLSEDRLGFQGYHLVNWKLNQEKVMTYLVDTDDEQRAIKVANEKRAQLIALNVWGDFESTCKLLR